MPALADADEVCAQLWQQEWAHDARTSDGMEFVGLVLNSMASTASCAHSSMRVTLVVSCTDTHSKANSGKGFDDALVAALPTTSCAWRTRPWSQGRTYASMAFVAAPSRAMSRRRACAQW